MSGAPLRVAVLGAGTVGREVVCALLERAATLRPADGVALVLTGIGVRDVERAVERGLPAELLTDAPAHLVADDEADVIVELMGGDEPAHTLISAALAMGKHVVTANKHVLAHHGAELEATARRNGATLRFEAAVGGGIPVLGPLATDLAANRIERVRGHRERHDELHPERDDRRGRAAGLRDRARRGPAPRLRRGRPVRRRRGPRRGQQARHPRPARLRSLARPGHDPDPAGERRRPGRTRDHHRQPRRPARRPERSGRIIRLLASASLDPDGSLSASVLPTALPLDSPLGRTDGVRNRIEVDALPVGRVAFDGPGAGGAATSSAVLGDLMAVARGAGSTWGPRPPAGAASGEPVAPRPGAFLETASGVRYPIDD